MEPINSLLHQLSQIPKPALSAPTILSLLAILMACMQSTLLIESTYPTPISSHNLIYLWVLEFIEISVIITAEVISCKRLQNVLKTTVQWLHWVPPCFVMVGLVKIYLGATFVLTRAYRSYQSGASLMRHPKKLHALLILICTSMTAIPSIILIGWRQQWWWKISSFKNSSKVVQAIQTHPFLSNVLFICSMGWSLCIISIGALIITIITYRKTVLSDVLHTQILLVVHFSAFPLLIVVVIAAARLHDKLDLGTFNVLKELSDAVIIIAFVDIAKALKTLFWDTSSSASIDEQALVSVPEVATMQQLNQDTSYVS